MELTLLRLPRTSGKDLNGMSWSPAGTLPQNQWRQPSVLVSQFLKLLRLSYNSLAPHHQQLHWKIFFSNILPPFVRMVEQKGGKRNLTLTSIVCWVPLHTP